MKKLFILLMLTGIVSVASAQVASYSFSQANNTYDTLTTGTILGSTTTAAGTYFYDTTTAGIAGSTTIFRGHGFPIGFSFTFNGIAFNRFGVNADGWISFGQDSVNMNSSAVNTPISATSTAPAALQNRVSGLGRSLLAQAVSKLSYATIGTAPNRQLVVQWTKYKRSTGGAVDTISFQIQLNETTNIVSVVYGKVKLSSGTTVQVGLRGTANTDYNNRLSTTSWATTTAGTANNSTITLSNTVFPASGLTFIWAPPLALDAGITVINSPSTAASSAVTGLNKIAVTIKNFGSNTLTSATIDWTVNGVAQTPHSWTGSLALAATNGPDTIGAYTFTTPGLYTIKAWSTSPNGGTDMNNANDTMTKIVYVIGYASIPFSENFDRQWVTGTSEVPSIYWKNSPNTGNSSWRRDDEGPTAAWTTATGAYTPTGAGGTAHSARFHSVSATVGTPGLFNTYINFSTPGTKMLSFWYINTSGNDSLNIYLSTDSGTTFIKKIKYINDATWTQYTVNLGSSVSPKAIIRFEGYSIAPATTTDLGIDSVQVYIEPAVDMAAVSWVAPSSGCGFTSTESLTIKARNNGADTLSKIPITYSTNGGVTYITPDTIAGPVPPGDTVTYTFTTTANMSNPGIYHCIFNVEKTGDANLLNDSLSTFITSLSNISGNPFVDSLEHGNNYYTLKDTTYGSVTLAAGVGTGASHAFDMTGGSAAGSWPAGTGTTTTGGEAFSYKDHVSKVHPCSVDRSAYPSGNLYLKIDLKQTYDVASGTGPRYSFFAIVANNTDTLTDITGTKFFNPTTSSSDPFATKVFNLSSFAGTTFDLQFIASNKYNDAFAGGLACHAYVDNIILSTKPIVNLGHDTAICPNGSITLDAGTSPTGYTYTYNWNTLLHPATIATTQTIVPDSSATYIATVDNGFGITNSDSVVIVVNPLAIVNAGPAQSLCYLDTLDITTATAANYNSLLWTTIGDGHFIHGNSLITNYVPGTTDITNGTVTLILTAYAICDTVSSIVDVTITSAPIANAGSNHEICYPGSVQLQATGGNTYSWRPSTGLDYTNISNPVASPTVTTTYVVTATSSCGTASANVTVTVDNITKPNLGRDTTLCATANININAGAGYDSYSWSTGATTQFITVDSATAHTGIGTIKVIVNVTKGVCTSADTINVTFATCTGIAEYNGSAKVSIYPNPTTGMINIVVNGLNKNADLTIYTLQGKQVYSDKIIGNSTKQLDLSFLSKGIYMIRIFNENNNILSKLIIQ